MSHTDEMRRLGRDILSKNIKNDSVGRNLTPEAHKRALDFAESVYTGNMGNGDAARLGIKHVLADVLKK